MTPVVAGVVEVRSPALIERLRTAAIDRGVRYRIEHSPQGNFGVTTTAAGIVRHHEGVALHTLSVS